MNKLVYTNINYVDNMSELVICEQLNLTGGIIFLQHILNNSNAITFIRSNSHTKHCLLTSLAHSK